MRVRGLARGNEAPWKRLFVAREVKEREGGKEGGTEGRTCVERRRWMETRDSAGVSLVVAGRDHPGDDLGMEGGREERDE